MDTEIVRVGPDSDDSKGGSCTLRLGPGDPWEQTQQLILLAFHSDNDLANLACQELLDRIDLPAIPMVLDDGRRRVIRREVVPQ